MSINRGMDKADVLHTHSGILLSHIKNEIMPFAATWMDPEIVILSEASRDRQYNIIYMGNLRKKGTNELFYKTEVQSQMQKTNT